MTLVYLYRYSCGVCDWLLFGAKTEDRTTTNQRLGRIVLELRHQNGICWVQSQTFLEPGRIEKSMLWFLGKLG